ncbi:MAG: c-type cytochrome [Thermoleophilia bacterium]
MYRTHRWLSVVPLLLIVAALVLAVGCGGDTVTTTAAPSTATTTTPDDDAIDAAAIFSANCGSCHGAGGEGGIGPDLRSLTDATLIEDQVSTGAGSMPPFGNKLSTDEISALATYVVDLE